VRASLTLLICLSLIGCKGDTSTLDKRVAFWNSALSRDIPVGTSTDEIRKWGVSHGVKFDYLSAQQWLYANVERVPEKGIPFPCSDWNIIIKISIDTANRSTKNNVGIVGTCI
jgi:hypothetical protein